MSERANERVSMGDDNDHIVNVKLSSDWVLTTQFD